MGLIMDVCHTRVRWCEQRGLTLLPHCVKELVIQLPARRQVSKTHIDFKGRHSCGHSDTSTSHSTQVVCRTSSILAHHFIETASSTIESCSPSK